MVFKKKLISKYFKNKSFKLQSPINKIHLFITNFVEKNGRARAILRIKFFLVKILRVKLRTEILL